MKKLLVVAVALVALVLASTVTAAVPALLESNVQSNRQGLMDCTGFDGYLQPLDSGNFNTARTSDAQAGFTVLGDFVDGAGSVTPYVGGTSGLRWWGINYDFVSTFCTDDDLAGTPFDIIFYDGDASGPGSVVATVLNVSPTIVDTGIPFNVTTIGEYTATFSGIDITGATWVSIQRQEGVTDCYWLWADENLVGSYDDLAVQDDGATPAIVDTDQTMCLQAFDPAEPTPTFNPGGEGGQPIPTMNRWGMLAMVGMLLGVAVLLIIRRK